jgi:predicted secreted hydrolase
MARGAVGLAGVERSENSARVFLGPWSVLMEPGKHRLKAITERFGLDLVLIPTKPPVPHGIRGYSLKGSKPESASCYYSFTRLKAAGSVNMGGKSVLVNGTAWMDHERRKDNDYSGASSGTFITRSGKSLHLNKEDFQADVVDHWKSERSGAIYPLRWRIRVFPIKLDLTVVPNMADQELITERTTRVSYWEGSVSVNGHYVDRSIDGDGYVEMTGYAKPFMLLEQ